MNVVNFFAEIANKVLNGCVTRKEVEDEQYKLVYEVDYLFLEEYSGQQQERNDEYDKQTDKHTERQTNPTTQEQCYNDSL